MSSMAGCARPVRSLDRSRRNACLAFSLDAFSSLRMSSIIGNLGKGFVCHETHLCRDTPVALRAGRFGPAGDAALADAAAFCAAQKAASAAFNFAAFSASIEAA